ncbi:MAG: hypothetical protein AAGD14_11125 [Planctomycetota bacterium]
MRNLIYLGAAFLVTLMGCVATPSESDKKPRAAVSSDAGLVLRVDGESIVLGQAAAPPLSAQVFAARVQQMASAGHDVDAGRFVRTYPDLAEQAVLSPEVSPPTQQTIAVWLDGLAAPRKGGWALLVVDRAENPGRYKAWEQQRAAAWSALRKGGFAEVGQQSLVPPLDVPAPWSSFDAVRLRATALLASSRPAEAATQFEQAAQIAVRWDSRVAARATLFAAFSHKLANNADAASKARAEALQFVSLPSVDDPMVLRLLLETKEFANASTDPVSQRQIRARLGRVEMQRGSPQAALLAWRAAENDAGAEPSLNQLRLGQAEALVGLGQDEPAIAMLIGLSRTDMRPRALIMLGLIQMRRGEVEIALTVLREAVKATTAQTHPDVYADAGLALLSVGEAETGLALLGESRAAYRALGDSDAVRRILDNQLRYAEAVGDTSAAREAKRDLARLRVGS